MRFGKLPLGLFAFLALLASTAIASPQAGEQFEIVRTMKSEFEQSRMGAKGSSFDRDVIVVRTVAVRQDGVELEYDLPAEVEPEQRAAQWQFPARVFAPLNGPVRLLNRAELEARRDRFLADAGWTAKDCGRWLFTWTAFKIECDPESVFEIVDRFTLQPPQLADGALFGLEGALGRERMTCQRDDAGGSACTVTLKLDPEAFRKARVESDVVAGDIVGTPVTREQATANRAGMQVSGTIAVTFFADAAGDVFRKTVVTNRHSVEFDGSEETATSKVTLERRRI